MARRLFRDWETEVDARIEAIRAERTGKGRTSIGPTTAAGGDIKLGPVHWMIKAPPILFGPRDELMGAWRPNGTPELDRAWYGPYVGDHELVTRGFCESWREHGPQIARAVARVMARAATEYSPDHDPFPITPHGPKILVHSKRP